MEKEKGYNGWANYETWLVSLWMDQDSDYWNSEAHQFYEFAKSDGTFTREERSTLDLADLAKEFHAETAPEINGVYADLVNASLGEVRWYEIAKHYINEIVSSKAA